MARLWRAATFAMTGTQVPGKAAHNGRAIMGRWLKRYAKPVPPNRYLAGLVWVPRVGWLVAVRYTHGKVILSENAYPSRVKKAN